MTPTNRLSSSPNNGGWLRPLGWAQPYLAVLPGLLLASAAYGLCLGELERARDTRQHIEQEWPLRSSGDESTQYIQKLGVRLAQLNAGGDGIPWRFSVVRNLAPNAFSIGAGYIFVTEGAITFAQNESEMAAIIAHELGHEMAGHFCSQASSDSRGLFDIFDSPAPERSVVVGAGSVRQTIDPRKEEQADQIAVAILRSAGYDPRALLQVAKRLPMGGESHLPDPRRIQSLERLVANRQQVSRDPPDSEAFKSVRRNLLRDTGQR